MRLLAILLALSAPALVGCGSAGPSDAPAKAPVAETAASRDWHQVADPPLSPRLGATAVWTGHEVLVFGGDPGKPCPPNADCVRRNTYTRDGAAFDPVSGSWRRLADAPHGIPDHVPDAFVNGHLYLTVGTRLLDYDVESDAWVQVDAPSDVEWRDLVVVGDKLVLPSGSDESGVHPDRVFDPSSGEWSTLPDDPIGPAFDRGLTATGSGAVLTGKELVPNPGADGPALVLAARLDEDLKTWHRLPDSDQLGGWAWGWTGERLVDPTPGGADGGEIGNYGRTVPYGGILDPATGQWSRLPDAPKEGSGGWPVDAHHGPLFATGGWLYDDEAGSWTRLPRAVDGPESPGSAAFMGGRLLVVGGIDWDAMEGELSPHAWVYAPASG